MANSYVAYILWFFLGAFGVHHFYLKRDRHAFVWWATLGGLFGLGWVRDFWRLPNYVEEANEDEDDYVSDNNNDDSSNARESLQPRLSSVRMGGMLAMGYIFGYLALFASPQEWYTEDGRTLLVKVFLLVVPPTACAIGVHLVANIGRMQASFQWSLLGAAIGVLWLWNDPASIGACCLSSTITVNWFGLAWKPRRRTRKSKCRRLSILFTCGTVYLLLWGSSLYYNAYVTTNDGKLVPLREALTNFFKSPAWVETKNTMYLMWEHIKVNGWQDLFEHIIEAIDPQGEKNAYKVLGVSSSASQDEIKKKYKQLAREWHPDKHTDLAKKQQAHDKFVEIQQAYETLSSIKTRRAEQNKKSSKRRNEF